MTSRGKGGKGAQQGPPATVASGSDAVQTDVESLFEALDRFIQNDQHKKALKTADDILKARQGDEDALRVRIAALLQLGEWAAALASIITAPFAASLTFEKAYCLYKLGRIEEGLAALSPLLSDGAQPALELAAQLHYRQGDTQRCIALYKALMQQLKADAGVELKSNVLAAYVAAGLGSELPGLMAGMKLGADASFEAGFNRACGLVAAGDWAAAEVALRRAIKLGRETLFDVESCSEAEVEEELAPLTVQLAYVLGRQGRTAEAQELYDTLLRGKAGGGAPAELADAPTRAVAVNNSFADSGRIDSTAAHRKTVTGAAKKLESLLEDPAKPGALTFAHELEARLSPEQKAVLSLNRALVYLLSGRVAPARDIAAALAAKPGLPSGRGPGSAARLLPLLQAAVLVQEGKAAEADTVLEQYVATAPVDALFEPALARVQLALDRGDVPGACRLLAAVPSGGGPPRGALVATHATLLQQAADTQGAEEVLRSALAALRAAKPPSASAAAGLSWCLEALTELQLRSGALEGAVTTYQQLAAASPGPPSSTTASLLSRLLWSVAVGGATAQVPSLLTKGLPSLAAEAGGLNLEVLENAVASSAAASTKLPVPAAQMAMEVDGGGESSAAAAAASTKKKRKTGKKRKRLPKGYDPALPNGGLPPPDPERWLPKWQRSDAKKRKLKSSARDKGVAKGSQGAGKVDDALDRSSAGKAQQGSGAGASAKPSLPARKKGSRK